MSVSKRIYQGVGANLFGQIVTICVQIISVPILISVWGMEKYGEWLVISAIPAYLAFSDLGLTTASANKIAIIYEKGHLNMSLRFYQTCFIIVNSICVIFLVLFGVLCSFSDSVGILNIQNYSNDDFIWLLIGLFIHVLLSIQTNIFSIPFRATKNTPLSVFLINVIRLSEWLIALGIVVYSSSAWMLVVALIISRAFGNIIVILISKRINSHFYLVGSKFDKKAITVLIKPALASMAFPIGLALTIQGVIILISIFAGGTSVALFNIYRTISRLLVQAVTVVNQSVWPELSYAYARVDVLLIKKILKKIGQLGICLAFFFIGIVYISADNLISIWVSDFVEQDDVLLILMLITTFTHVMWQKYWVFLMATNNHIEFAKYFLEISLASFLLVAILLNIYGLYGSVIALFFGEVFYLIFSHRYYLKVMNKLC